MKLLSILFIVIMGSAQAGTVTVSGLSSGGYMAQQFHTAFSKSISGVGILAAGPYYCAQGSVIVALNQCMDTYMGLPTVRTATDEALRLERIGAIDPLKNLRDARVYIFSGTLDETVLPKVAEVLVHQYQDWGVKNIFFENHMRVGHAFPTLNYGNGCKTVSQSPFISNCNRDIAGEILNYLNGPLQPKMYAKRNRLFKFSQPSSPRNGLYREGYAYVPLECQNTSSCDIHVAFHGCRQTVDEIGDQFYTKTGYNDWAESNKLIILYPQIQKDQVVNPKGCWDWWGYASKDYHTKNGVQMRAVMDMIRRVQKRTVKFQTL